MRSGIEQDDRTGDFGVLETLAKVDWGSGGDGLFSQVEKSIYDFMSRLKATNGWVTTSQKSAAVRRRRNSRQIRFAQLKRLGVLRLLWMHGPLRNRAADRPATRAPSGWFLRCAPSW